MSLLDANLAGGRAWKRVSDCYLVTKKPRGLDLDSAAQIPFAAMESIPQDGSYEPIFAMRELGVITSGTYFESGDLLIAKITPSFENGKQALARNLPASFGYATTEVIPLRPRDAAQDSRLLFFYLLHPDVRHFIAERMEGSTGRQRVPDSVLLDLPIPELEPDEQAAIANVLETVQRARAWELDTELAAGKLKRVAMRELFTRGLRSEPHMDSEVGKVPESWIVEHIGSHHHVVSGGTPARGTALYWDGGDIPWVKTAEIDYCEILTTEEHITRAGLNESAAKLLPPRTLLLAMYGQGVTRGKVAILGVDAACNQACAAILPTSGSVLTKYLYHFLTFRYEAIRQLAHGGQQQNLNLEIVREFPIAYPSEEQYQHEIVAILDAIDRKIDLHKRKRAVLEELFKSLLHKLMTGEIRVADLDLSALDSMPAALAEAS
jgi:type I restriction enzyme S subunit